MCKHLVLVDFDGVILKNRYANEYINKKVCNYIKKCTPFKNAAMINELNKQMYTAYGHTVIGLQRLGYPVSLHDFNEYVYGNESDYKDLALTKEEQKQWEEFSHTLLNANYDVKIFSNANKHWLTHFIGYDPNMFAIQDFMESYQNETCFDIMLKPNQDIYYQIMHMYPKHAYHFIDDKMHNFSVINNDKRWTKLWYSSFVGENKSKIGKQLYVVNDLPSAAEVIYKLQ